MKRSSALASTDEFWLSPVTKAVVDDSSSSSSCPSSSDATSMPPAHHQLLSDDVVSYECLKGYDHTEQQYSYDSLDSYTSDAEEDVPSCFRHKVSSVKQQGGGSWLLGFARLSNTNSNDGDDMVTVVSQDNDGEDVQPGLVRVSSRSSLSSDDSSDDESVTKPTKRSRSKGGVSFATEVKVQPIPHSSTLSPIQRRKMYSTSYEVRQNKIRNKKEYRYDGYDWRNVTEEWEMGVDMVTGELIHPVHEH